MGVPGSSKWPRKVLVAGRRDSVGRVVNEVEGGRGGGNLEPRRGFAALDGGARFVETGT